MKIKSLANKKTVTFSIILAALAMVVFYSASPVNGASSEHETCALREITLTPPSGIEGDPLVIKAEVAITDAQRQQGLMFRKSMPQYEGMIFYWEEPQRVFMWMKNTYIPLDMIYIKGAEVVGVIEAVKTQDTTPLTIPMLADTVLEVNHGLAAEHGVTRGWRVKKGSCL